MELPKISKPFVPTEDQGRAKVEFYRWLDNQGGLRSAESLGMDELVRICRTGKIQRWLARPAFQRWFYNRDYFSVGVEALRDRAIDELKRIAFDGTGLIEPKDKLKALNMILQLSDSFPKAAPQVLFAGVPAEIQALPEVEVERQLQEGRKRLAAARPSAPAPEDSDG